MKDFILFRFDENIFDISIENIDCELLNKFADLYSITTNKLLHFYICEVNDNEDEIKVISEIEPSLINEDIENHLCLKNEDSFISIGTSNNIYEKGDIILEDIDTTFNYNLNKFVYEITDDKNIERRFDTNLIEKIFNFKEDDNYFEDFVAIKQFPKETIDFNKYYIINENEDSDYFDCYEERLEEKHLIIRF